MRFFSILQLIRGSVLVLPCIGIEPRCMQRARATQHYTPRHINSSSDPAPAERRTGSRNSNP
jgi:hypothetical protein